MRQLVVYCADVGSIARGRFGWACGTERGQPLELARGSDIRELVNLAAHDLNSGTPVAMGFECPLFVPVVDDPNRVLRGRLGDGARPWSAAAGAGALVLGIAEVLWILRRIRGDLRVAVPAFLTWSDFVRADCGLFLWEAFVTATGKGKSHMDDAENAVRAFLAAMPNPEAANAIREREVHSLMGAALLGAGWSSDVALLESPCLVIRAGSSRGPEKAARGRTESWQLEESGAGQLAPRLRSGAPLLLIITHLAACKSLEVGTVEHHQCP